MRFSIAAVIAFIAYINTQALAAPTRSQNDAHVNPHDKSSHDNGHREPPHGSHDSSNRQRERQRFEPAPATAGGATDPPQGPPPAKRGFQEIEAREPRDHDSARNLRLLAQLDHPSLHQQQKRDLEEIEARDLEEIEARDLEEIEARDLEEIEARDLEEIEARDFEIEDLD